jgi:hypothetical protein
VPGAQTVRRLCASDVPFEPAISAGAKAGDSGATRLYATTRWRQWARAVNTLRQRLVGQPASESGRLHQGADGAPRGAPAAEGASVVYARNTQSDSHFPRRFPDPVPRNSHVTRSLKTGPRGGAAWRSDEIHLEGKASRFRSLRAPATIDDEGLADAAAASPFRLPRLHPGSREIPTTKPRRSCARAPLASSLLLCYQIGNESGSQVVTHWGTLWKYTRRTTG